MAFCGWSIRLARSRVVLLCFFDKDGSVLFGRTDARDWSRPPGLCYWSDYFNETVERGIAFFREGYKMNDLSMQRLCERGPFRAQGSQRWAFSALAMVTSAYKPWNVMCGLGIMLLKRRTAFVPSATSIRRGCSSSSTIAWICITRYSKLGMCW
jgi:hypothetical protein